MTILQTPSLTSIDRAVTQLREGATPKEQRQIDKAAHALHKGLDIVATTDGALLIPSASRATTYRLTAMGVCSCPASAGCYHQKMQDILITAHAHPCADPPSDGDGPNPGDAEPGIGGGEGGDPPPEWRRPVRDFNTDYIIAKVRAALRPTMPNLIERRSKALTEINELFN